MSDPFRQLRLAQAEEGASTATSRADNAFAPTPPRSVSSDATAPTAAVTPLGAMLARHILRDGEVILLVLKPSFWFILLSSLRFMAAVSIVALGAIAWEGRNNREWFYIEAAIFILAGRTMWAVLQWMGRLYILTDQRVIRLSGVLKLEIFDCALRKIARTQVTASVKERLCATGSIEIIPSDESCVPGVWQTVRRPLEVNELIVSTINKAKQHGYVAAA
jgi:hypothetical protein